MTEIRETQSSQLPPLLTSRGGQTYINVALKQRSMAGALFYHFIRLPVETPASFRNCEQAVYDFYDSQIKEAGDKGVDAIRTTLLGTASDYDEARLMDVEFNVNLLRAELNTTLQELQEVMND